MLFWTIILLVSISCSPINSVPVIHMKQFEVLDAEKYTYDNITFFDELNKKDYAQYMQEVLKELESDENFQNQILSKNGTASTDDYTHALQFASTSIRSKLDEIKRREIERLNKYEEELRKMVKSKNIADKGAENKFVSEYISDGKSHIHSTDNSQFTENDLRTLIGQIQHDIKLTDVLNEKEYRRNEWRKQIIEKRKLASAKSEVIKKKIEAEISKRRSRFKGYKKLHEPGSENQMKEVWKNNDHLDTHYFNVKTFFNLHDINQDGIWDIAEIEAMLYLDVNSSYSGQDKTPDQIEIFHELMKMRQHFLEKMDINKDQVVSLEEFSTYSTGNHFKDDEEWTIAEDDEKTEYNEMDMAMFEKELKAIQKSVPASLSQNEADKIESPKPNV